MQIDMKQVPLKVNVKVGWKWGSLQQVNFSSEVSIIDQI